MGAWWSVHQQLLGGGDCHRAQDTLNKTKAYPEEAEDVLAPGISTLRHLLAMNNSTDKESSSTDETAGSWRFLVTAGSDAVEAAMRTHQTDQEIQELGQKFLSSVSSLKEAVGRSNEERSTDFVAATPRSKI